MSVAFGARYLGLLDRLDASLDAVGFAGERLIWRDALPAGSPPHDAQPYAFKLAAFAAAAEVGVREALWLDAACVALRPLGPLLDHVESCGVLLFDNPPHTCGHWTSDAALPLLGFRDRDQAMGAPQCTASLVGLDLGSTRGAEFLARWRGHLERGAFPGAWSNARGEASEDRRCLGHRHDQSAASAVAWHMGVPLLPWGWFVDVKTQAPEHGTIIALDRRRILH